MWCQKAKSLNHLNDSGFIERETGLEPDTSKIDTF